jgi:NAD(P)-dependent dehydrogenase (short-subunit alcohol dehydrogenase family)
MIGRDHAALVTGADHGLGAALSGALAERGCRVFAGRHGMGRDRIDELSDMFKGLIIPVPMDVSSDKSVAEGAGLIARATDRIDLIFNNAGVLGATDPVIPGRLDFDDILSTYNVNAVGPLRVINAVYRLLAAGQTRIAVSVSSEAGSVGTCGRRDGYGYCMSKAGLNMASALVHNLLRPIGGVVIVVHPGWMRTWMRGARDEEAPITPERSAEGILKIVERAMAGEEIFRGAQPAFLDCQGRPMPW